MKYLMISFVLAISGIVRPALAEPARHYTGLRDELKYADAVLRVEVRDTKVSAKPNGWQNDDPPVAGMTAESDVRVKKSYKGVLARAGETMHLKMDLVPLAQYYQNDLAAVSKNFFSVAPLVRGDDRIVLIRAEDDGFDIVGVLPVFFDWVVSSDTLMSQYVDLAFADAAAMARATTKLIVQIGMSDPTIEDTYGAKVLLLDEWQRYRKALPMNEPPTIALLQSALTDVVNSLRFGPRSLNFGVAAALAPLYPEDDRRQLVSALLQLEKTVSEEDSAASDELQRKRNEALRQGLPHLMYSVMHPTNEDFPDLSDDQIGNEAKRFAPPVKNRTELTWEQWLQHFQLNAQQFAQQIESQANATALAEKATTVVLAQRSGEKIGPAFHLITLKVLKRLKDSKSADKAAPFLYVWVTPEDKSMLAQRFGSAAGQETEVIAFLREVPAAEQNLWAYRGQQLGSIDERRFVFIDPLNGILLKTPERLAALSTPQNG